DRTWCSPAVIAPYGMPLKMLIPSSVAPRTFPLDVVAIAGAAAAEHASRGPAQAPAKANATSLTHALRLDPSVMTTLQPQDAPTGPRRLYCFVSVFSSHVSGATFPS